MSIQSLDKRVNFSMLISSLGNKIKGVMAKSIEPEEKLKMIISEMERDVAQKRATARAIRAKMVALADPETATLEPLERIRVQREKLVAAGKNALSEQEKFQAENNESEAKKFSAQVQKIAKEIKSLDTRLNSMESTYETLKESYEVAIENYKTAQSAYEHTKTNGESVLFAIKAHQEALKMRDNVRKDGGTESDTSFLNDLESELVNAQTTLRSDKQIDKELDGGCHG